MTRYIDDFSYPVRLPATDVSTNGATLAAALQHAVLKMSVPNDTLLAIWDQPFTTVSCIVKDNRCHMQFHVELVTLKEFLQSKKYGLLMKKWYQCLLNEVYANLQPSDDALKAIFIAAYGGAMYLDTVIQSYLPVETVTYNDTHALAKHMERKARALPAHIWEPGIMKDVDTITCTASSETQLHLYAIVSSTLDNCAALEDIPNRIWRAILPKNTH